MLIQWRILIVIRLVTGCSYKASLQCVPCTGAALNVTRTLCLLVWLLHTIGCLAYHWSWTLSNLNCTLHVLMTLLPKSMKAIGWCIYLQVFRAGSSRKSGGITCIHVGCIDFEQSPACLFSHAFLLSKSVNTTTPTSQLHQHIQYSAKTRYKYPTSIDWT